jgi:hypothetical protein
VLGSGYFRSSTSTIELFSEQHDEETRLNSVSCGFGAGSFFEKMVEVDGL